MSATLKDFSFEEIEVGHEASFSHAFTADDVATFAKLSGDENPLHMDDAYAGQTKFRERVVHGMLVASLCSQLVGMHLPGKRCLFLKQDLLFKEPVFINDEITVHGKVVRKIMATQMIEIEVIMKKADQTVISGTALVQVI